MSQSGAVRNQKETDIIEKVTALATSGKHQEALVSIEEGLGLFPNSIVLLIKKSQILFHSKQYRKTIAAIESATSCDLKLEIIKAKSYHALGKVGLAKELLEALRLEYCRTIEDANFLDIALGNILYDEMQFDKALVLYQTVLKSNPRHQEALDATWNVYDVSNKYKECIKYYNELLELDSYNEQAWLTLGYAYNYNKQKLDAAHAFDMASTINDKNKEAVMMSAQCLKESAKYEKAIALYLQLMEDNDDIQYTFMLDLAECYLALENYNLAFFYASKFSLDNQTNWYALLLKGICLVRHHNHFEAIENYESALKIGGNHTLILINLALAHYHVGEQKKAFDYFMEALDDAPDNFQYWQFVIEFLYKHEDYDAAQLVASNAHEVFHSERSSIMLMSSFFKLGDKVSAYNAVNHLTKFGDHLVEKLLTYCPELTTDKQFRGFYRYCTDKNELPNTAQLDFDLPDGYIEFA
jgi:tetratricopeptide (TPR) repeat protein